MRHAECGLDVGRQIPILTSKAKPFVGGIGFSRAVRKECTLRMVYCDHEARHRRSPLLARGNTKDAMASTVRSHTLEKPSRHGIMLSLMSSMTTCHKRGERDGSGCYLRTV